MTDIHAVAASYEAERAARALAAEVLTHRREIVRLQSVVELERERADFWRSHCRWSNDILVAYVELLAQHGI